MDDGPKIRKLREAFPGCSVHRLEPNTKYVVVVSANPAKEAISLDLIGELGILAIGAASIQMDGSVSDVLVVEVGGAA